MPFAELRDKRIWYEINGQGEPLVQLPGGALGLRNFSRITPVLARHFKVVDKGCVSHQLQKCLEKPNRYTLLVNWQTLEDHTLGFRRSTGYQ